MTLLDMLMERLKGKTLTFVSTMDESHPCIGDRIANIRLDVNSAHELVEPDEPHFVIETDNGSTLIVDDTDEVMYE